jgi:hypothetical protein
MSETVDAESLREPAFRDGAVLFGIADITDLKNRFLLSAAETAGLVRAVSIAVPLSPAVLSGISGRPTLLYNGIISRQIICSTASPSAWPGA